MPINKIKKVTLDDLLLITVQAAKSNNDAKVVQALLALGANVNASDNGGFTALMKSASAGHQEIVRLLLAYNANVPC